MRRLVGSVLAVLLAFAVVLTGVGSMLTSPVLRQPQEADGASVLLARQQPGQQVTVTVMGESGERNVTLTLGELPVGQ